MKFALALTVHIALALLLVWAIVLAVKGNPWLLLVGISAYLLAFWRIGCTSH